MGNYVENNLLPGEQIVYAAKVSSVIYAPFVALSLFMVVMGFFVGQLHFIFWILAVVIMLLGGSICAIRQASTEVAVTNKRLVLKMGFVTRETVEQFLEKIDSISVEQSIMDRLTNAGTIIVRGSGQTFSPVANIDAPLVFRKMVNEQVDKIKNGKN
jgi:uncharacterized membrane protein YdbT with pleckstrin-like domain